MNDSIFFLNKDAKLGEINDANELFLHEYELRFKRTFIRTLFYTALFTYITKKN